MSKTFGKVHIRELMKFPPHELLTGLKNSLTVVWDDGVETDMSSKEIIVNRWALDILNGIPPIPLVSRYNITNYYSGGLYVAKTINKLYEAIVKDVTDILVKGNNDRSVLRELYRNMYNVVNDMYIHIIYDIPEYAVTLDILDFVEVQIKEELLKSLVELKKDIKPDNVNKTYAVLDKLLTKDPTLADNRLSKGYISGTFNPNQLKQILAARGYGTELNSELFKTPIYSSYCVGLYNIYAMAVESRGAAKALFVSTKAIQTSEYFARELQLVTMNVEKLVDGDCGNREYIDWFVRPADETTKADLPNLIGKYYLNEKGEEEEITAKHKHLEGATIKIRSAMNCKCKEANSICTRCFGALSYGLFPHTNIGHVSATSLTQKISQSILSTKHLVSSATSADISLDDNAKLFFNVVKKNYYGFKKEMLTNKDFKLRLIVSQYEAYGIKNLSKNTDITKLYPNKLSRINSIKLELTDSKGEVIEYPIEIRNGNKRGSFTIPFLAYIIKHGYVIDDLDRYIIDLSNWKNEGPVIGLPEIEFNFLELVKQIKHEFTSIKAPSKTTKAPITKEMLLQKLFDLVNRKLDVNIALLEVIIYAFTIQSHANKDYRLSRGSVDPQLASIQDIIVHRSVGGLYAWQSVMKYILNPTSFNGENNIDHIMDIMLRPKETLIDKHIKATLH